jgi:thiamine-phosphate pyrophosphorylase
VKHFDPTLYLVTDTPGRYRHNLLDEVAAAIDGGVTVVQFRSTQAGKRTLYDTAIALRTLTRGRGVALIINDHIDLALAVDADGAHVGQDDLPPAVARRLIGPEKILGVSVSTRQEFAAVDCSGVDYLGVGPIFPTGSKFDAAAPSGLAFLAEIVARSPRPVVAIGGISLELAPEVYRTGVAGIAVIAALSQASDPAAAARTLRAAAQRA